MAMDNGGYLIPASMRAELGALIEGDPRPEPPKWWQFWRRAAYRREDEAWQDRWMPKPDFGALASYVRGLSDPEQRAAIESIEQEKA